MESSWYKPIYRETNDFTRWAVGTLVGKKNPHSEISFDARHDATKMTPKKYINKLLWDDKAKIGTVINIPKSLFTTTNK